MIGKLKGIINICGLDSVIVDVNGVGYIVYCPKSVISQLQDGEAAELWIEMDVKQDAIQLYGFKSMEDKRWFNLLQSVQGVGAKVALNILGTYSVNALVSALISSDKMAFQKISGIGPKLAQRILLEMADKLPKHLASNSVYITSSVTENQSSSAEAISALANLGFSRTTAAEVISTICAKEPAISLEDLIRKGLKALSN